MMSLERKLSSFVSGQSAVQCVNYMRIKYAHTPSIYNLRIYFLPFEGIDMFAAAKVIRKPTNISLPVDLSAEAKVLGLNISQICEKSLREVVRQEKERRWNEQNAVFLVAYNDSIESHGLALQEWRAF